MRRYGSPQPGAGVDALAAGTGARAGAAPSSGRLVVGIGEYAVSGSPRDTIVTHALGSCIAVIVWDPTALVGGLLHFLLPDSRINAVRAREQPATFADTGLPLLFEAVYALGAVKSRCVVRIAGGAEIANAGSSFDIGRRNILAVKNLLWRNGLLISAEAVGGSAVRTVNFSIGDGRVQITCGRDQIQIF